MNVTAYPNALGWLFAKRTPDHCCIWSFGRHPPRAELGDDLLFRDHATGGGRVIARAFVRAIYPPGECDVPMFDGSRTLKGWKLLWYQQDFEDLRRANLPEAFGKPLTDKMERILHDHDAEGNLSAGWTPAQLRPLVDRGLVEPTGYMSQSRLTLEGWRAVRRHISDGRQLDLEHTPEAPGSPVCRICGCTEKAGCPEGCWWAAPNLCSTCKPIVDRCLAASSQASTT